MKTNNNSNLAFLVHPNTRIEITKFIPIQGEIGMETKYSFSFPIPTYQTVSRWVLCII